MELALRCRWIPGGDRDPDVAIHKIALGNAEGLRVIDQDHADMCGINLRDLA